MQQFNNPHADFGAQHSPPLEGCPQDGVVSKQIAKNYYVINDAIVYHQPKLNLPCNIKLKDRAKLLRYAENLTEIIFWMQITKKRFHEIDFDRQRIIGNYIVDFYVKKLGLIIEIDGASHDDKEVYDKAREEYFISLGLKIYRITVDDVMKNMEFVKMGLEEYIIKEYGIGSG